MASTSRSSAEKRCAQLTQTAAVARNHIDAEASARAEKIAKLRSLRLGAANDQSKSVSRER